MADTADKSLVTDLTDFRLPSLGSDMDRGTIIEWLVAPGDEVTRGDILLRVDTEKADIDVETWEDGVIVEILAPVGDEVPVGTVLARLATGEVTSDRSDGENSASEAETPEDTPLSVSDVATGENGEIGSSEIGSSEIGSSEIGSSEIGSSEIGSQEVASEATPPTTGGERRTSYDPVAPGMRILGAPRTKAAERPDVFVTPRTVFWPSPERRPNPAPAPKSVEKAERLSGEPPAASDGDGRMRSAIARLMTKSNREIPHFHVLADIDMSAAAAWLDEQNRYRSSADRLLAVALLIRATALTCEKHPGLCGHWIADGFAASPTIDVGLAVHLRSGGLVNPTITDAAGLDIDATMVAVRDVTSRARRRGLRSSDLSPAAITITSLGDRGTTSVIGVIHPPQVALLGFGTIHDAAAVQDGAVVVRPTVTTTLSVDHRAADGHDASAFLATLTEFLAHPDQL